MNHTLFAWCELKECAEVLDTDNSTLKNLSLFEIASDDFNGLHCLCNHIGICTTYRNISIICNIDLYASFSDDTIDYLTLLSNNITLLVGVEDKMVQTVIDIIKEYSHSRKQVIPNNDLSFDFDTSMPLEVSVGGATIFVVDVDRFEKV